MSTMSSINGEFSGLEEDEAQDRISEFWSLIEKNCLTIKDVRRFKPGEKYLLATTCRNFYDYVFNAKNAGTIISNIPYPAYRFFRLCKIMNEYTHEDGVSGFLHFQWDDSKELDDQKFEFHLRYNVTNWYPLDENGDLPCGNCRERVYSCKHGRNWRTFPDDTLLGYRGEMIPYERVLRLPDIIVDENDNVRFDESSYERLEKEERLRELFAAYAIQRKWRYVMNKRKFDIVMGELKALPGAVDYETSRASFYEKAEGQHVPPGLPS